jgi:Domain of unknown function (DUF4124)
MKAALVLALAMACLSAFAQVYRCPDKATGKLTYSDAPCSDGQQIVRQRTPEERLLDAERADLARQRIQLSNERAAVQQQQSDLASQPRYPGPSQPAVDPFLCRKAEREVNVASNTQSGSPTDKRRRMNAAIIAMNNACGKNTELIQEPSKTVVTGPPDAPKPTAITNCRGGICRDNTGGVYYRSGKGFMTGPSGKTCHRAGVNWICN